MSEHDKEPQGYVAMKVSEGLDGRRVAAVLAAEVPGLSRKQAKALLAQGKVLLNGRRLKKDVVVSAGTTLEIEGLARELTPNPEIEVEIVGQGDGWLAVNKPSGVPCHPLRADETNTLVNGVLARFPEIVGVGYGPLEPGLVHRIDVDTSGAVLVARTQLAFRRLTSALEAGDVYKEYVAICAGTPRERVIDAPLGNHSTDKRRAAVRPDDPKAKSGSTTILRVVPRGAFSEVHVRADRATRHQVRVHLAWVGHPLVGDVIYGGPSCELDRHLLHASRIAFTDEGQYIDVRVPCPTDVEAFLAKAAGRHHT